MITRFAPSPTGPLHLGHAYSVMYAFDLATKNNGQFLLRIEDIDGTRSKKGWETQIFEELDWLGIRWTKPIVRQSERLAEYTNALKKLEIRGLLYNCTCNRRDIQEATSAPQETGEPSIGPDGIVYPGICREKLRDKPLDYDKPIRLDAALAFDTLTQPLNWSDNGLKTISKEVFLMSIGDVVLSRKDMGTSYHLSVVIDDAAQQVTDVVRGEDLANATAIHALLQALLNLPTPIYHHHHLIRDEMGKRLAKRDDAQAISSYRNAGATPSDIRRMVRLSPAP
jgi:glutamyl-Q tRNA(Asp) synthetase